MASGEQQHQEALVAGESPDRSERERSSGETTGSGGTVARPDETAEKEGSNTSGTRNGQNGSGTATQDAKSSKIPAPASPAGEPDEPADPDETADAAEMSDEAAADEAPESDRRESGEGGEERAEGDDGDERLKSAVAAWVAGDGTPAGPEGVDGAEDAKTPESDGKSDGDGKSAGEDAGGTSMGAASTDLPVRPKPAEAGADSDSDADSDAGAGAESDSGSGKDAGKGAERGAEPAPQGDAPTAMFGVVRRESDRSGKDDDTAAADRAERLTSAFFGAPKDTKDAKGTDEDEKSDPDSSAGSGTKAKPAVDQPTAVFRTTDVKRDAGGTGKDGASGKSAKPEEGEKPEAPEKSEKSEKQKKSEEPGRKGSATPSGAPDPRKLDDLGGQKGSRGGQKDDRSAPKGGSGPDKGSSAESDAERTSQFVPLRSADEPRTPAKSGTPAAAAPTAPDKPASAPSAPPANPWSSAPPRPTGAPQAPPEAPGAAESEPERTRQQPMPGSPEADGAGQQPQPLDLLAQLTNSPPPPETPLRTITRRVKIWTPLVLLLAVVFVVVQAVRPLPNPELSMTAAGTYTFEGSKPSMPWPSEGQAVIDVAGLGSFGSYGKQKPVPIASVAKVMTAYVILRDHPVKKGSKGKMIPVDQKAEEEAGLSAQNESTVNVKAGQKISQREAMDAIMIASANNVARLLARWDAGSEKAFVKKMNAAAKDLGMTNSHYTDPSGLTASTVSTAADQVKLGKKVMESPLFREVVRQPQYEDTNGKTQPNWNRLVPMDGVVGIKTGTTTKAGGNLLFAAEKEIGGTKQLIIGAVLGQYEPSILDTVLAASKKLIDAGQDALTAKKVVKKGQVVGYVDDQLGGKTPVVATKDVTAVGWPGLKVELELTDNGKAIPHKAGPGTKVGTLTAGDGPGQVKVPVAVQDDLTEPGFGDKLTRVG
ncbi:serine hydrolase [Streptomyces sp. CA-250714]|uniref:serine hydrolase n=1 Tax=Streptomyces sp. CA-250714 TaxID=3240060 RepID=UPI003D8C6569